jgi:hypothetical protein
MITSEWGKPSQFENGLVLEDLVSGRYGRKLYFWDMRRRRNIQTVDLGEEYQLDFELRPAHEPRKSYGFVNVVLNIKDLSSSIWTWYREEEKWAVRKVIDIPAEPAGPGDLPPLLKGFKALPPLVTDIDLSLDDRFLYVSCWGTGELRQYDVSNPFDPKLTGKVQIGGIVRPKGHPKSNGAVSGGPQMVEISRDGRRDLFVWSFLMATAHGAGLMVAPKLLNIAGGTGSGIVSHSSEVGMSAAILLHTLAMLTVMAPVAWIVYRKLGLTVLRKSWINFDLIWAGALLVVGAIALYKAL